MMIFYNMININFIYGCNFAYASEDYKYEDDTDLNSLDLSFNRDVLKLYKKDKSIKYLDETIQVLNNLEKPYYKLGQKIIKPFKKFYSKYIKGDKGYAVSKTFEPSWKFYIGEYENLKEYKKLVKEYNVRKSVDEKTLSDLIDKKIISNNEKFNEMFKQWSNIILNYYSHDDSLKDLSKYDKFTINDISFWYIKEDIEYVSLPKAINIAEFMQGFNGCEIGGGEDAPNSCGTIFSNRIMFKSDEFSFNWDDKKSLYESFKDKWHLNFAYQIDYNAYLNFDDYIKKIKRSSFIPGNKLMMFGSSDLNNPNENFGFHNILMDHFYDGTEWPSLIVKYHKFLVRLPNNKFKISYIVDFDGNRRIDSGAYYLNGQSRFTEYFPKIVKLKSDELYNYFINYNFYDYDISKDKGDNININDLFIPYNSDNIDNKTLLNKLNNIDDFLYFLLNNLNYTKHFNNINKRLDNYDGLFLKFDKKLDTIIDKLNNHKLFDYAKLNKIVKDNLEEFNKKYIEGLSKDLKYITNLVRENKVEILKNNEKIVDVYNKMIEIDNNIELMSNKFNKFDQDLEYIKSNLKSTGQSNQDNNFQAQFHDPNKNRVADSLNFFDKFINFFTNFFNVTEKFNFKKLDTSKLYKKIPFSLFYDIKYILTKLVAPPKVPKFEIPIYTEKFVIDFDKFESLAVIVRTFIILNVVIFLCMAIYKKVG